MSDFQSGLMISIVGLAVTFIALLIFIGVMVLLQKLFPVKKNKTAVENKVVAEEKAIPASTKDDIKTDEITAAIAAVAYLRSQRAGQLGASLATGPGPYRMFKMVDKRN